MSTESTRSTASSPHSAAPRAPRSPWRTARHGLRAEDGISLIDSIIVMMLIAIVGAISVTSLGQYREASQASSTRDDALRLVRAVEAAYPTMDGYPANRAALLANFPRYKVSLTDGNRVAWYGRTLRTDTQAEGFALCVEHVDSSSRTVGYSAVISVDLEGTDTGDGGCPALPSYVYAPGSGDLDPDNDVPDPDEVPDDGSTTPPTTVPTCPVATYTFGGTNSPFPVQFIYSAVPNATSYTVSVNGGSPTPVSAGSWSTTIPAGQTRTYVFNASGPAGSSTGCPGVTVAAPTAGTPITPDPVPDPTPTPEPEPDPTPEPLTCPGVSTTVTANASDLSSSVLVEWAPVATATGYIVTVNGSQSTYDAGVGSHNHIVSGPRTSITAAQETEMVTVKVEPTRTGTINGDERLTCGARSVDVIMPPPPCPVQSAQITSRNIITATEFTLTATWQASRGANQYLTTVRSTDGAHTYNHAANGPGSTTWTGRRAALFGTRSGQIDDRKTYGVVTLAVRNGKTSTGCTGTQGLRAP